MAEDELFLRQMPHSMEAEQAVLGSILIDASCVTKVIGRLRPEDFYLRQNQDIYAAIYSMFVNSAVIDPVTVLAEMRQQGTFDEANSANYLLQLMDTTPTAANVELYADIVQDRALLRRIAETSDYLNGLVRQGDSSGADVLEVAEQKVYALRQGRASKDLVPISKAVLEVYDRLMELSASGSDIPGLSTGLRDLDRVTSGLNKSDLIILGAHPGMGKTSLALNILLHAGKKSGKNVVFFSLEMSRVQLAMRLISGEAFVDNKKLVTGRLNDEDWESISAAANALSKTTILLDDDATLSVAEMNAKCRRVENLGLVVVDYLQLMTAADKGKHNESRQETVASISRAMKIMAKDLNVPVLCLSQLSRSDKTRSRSEKRPVLSDLRESGAIEQDADIVMFLYREDTDQEDSHNLTECIIAKNRHGETCTVDLQWLPAYTTFSDVERRYGDD